MRGVTRTRIPTCRTLGSLRGTPCASIELCLYTADIGPLSPINLILEGPSLVGDRQEHTLDRPSLCSRLGPRKLATQPVLRAL